MIAEQSIDAAVPTVKTRMAYSMKLKLEAIQFSEQASVAAAAKKFKVDRKQIQNWRRAKRAMEDAVASGSSSCKRSSGGGRKLLYPLVNERVRDWVLQKREDRKCVSCWLICLEAQKIVKECAGHDWFSASLGWLEKFLKRNNFSFRATTTICQCPLMDSVEKLVNFMLFVRRLCDQNRYQEGNIFACDETAV